ncbi:hypothetical protein PO124_08625 [Bacillus licheniformis]|nr:hypothetical protein [Bacillus licheniformis]
MEKKHGVLSIRDDGIPLLIWRSTRRSFFWHSENKIPPTIRFTAGIRQRFQSAISKYRKEINLDAVKNTVWAL